MCVYARAWVIFRVSDYLTNAPTEIFEDLAKSLYVGFAGKNIAYPASLKEWVLRPEFCTDKRDTYLDRHDSLTKSTKGDYLDLEDSLGRLQESGLVPEIKDLYISWSKDSTQNRPGENSVLMKTVSVSKDFDTKNTPEWVIDWALYYEICPLLEGFNPDTKIRMDENIEKRRKKYARWEEAEEYAKKHIY